MSVEPARHSSTKASSTVKYLYICVNQCPSSQLDIPAQTPAQQQKDIYVKKLYHKNYMAVEPARHSSSTASSTVKVLIYMLRSMSFEPARHFSSTASLTVKIHI